MKIGDDEKRKKEVSSHGSHVGNDDAKPLSRTIVQQIKDKFELLPHPEGGFYKETYRSSETIQCLYGERVCGTAIYFLITPGSVSRFHRIRADETWHFYLGGPMTVVELCPPSAGDDNSNSNSSNNNSSADNTGSVIARCTTLGQDVLRGELVQYTVRAGTWFGSFPNEGTDYSFVGCTVSPGFEFRDFELGSRAKLLREFPNIKNRALISKLTEGLP